MGITKEQLAKMKSEALAKRPKNWIRVGYSTCGVAAGAKEVLETLGLCARVKMGRFRWALFFPFPGIVAVRIKGTLEPDRGFTEEDRALLNTFGRGGLGLFPAPLALAEEVDSQLNAQALGPLQGVSEQIFAISSERRIRHPAVEALCRAAPGANSGPTL